MLIVEKSQMIVIEGRSGADLQAQYNTAMDGLTRADVVIEDRIISIEKLSAIILYKSKVKIPQNLRDKYALKDIYPTCDGCPYYESDGRGGGYCPYAKGRLVDHDEICKRRWTELERDIGRREIDVSNTASGDSEERCIQEETG